MHVAKCIYLPAISGAPWGAPTTKATEGRRERGRTYMAAAPLLSLSHDGWAEERIEERCV